MPLDRRDFLRLMATNMAALGCSMCGGVHGAAAQGASHRGCTIAPADFDRVRLHKASAANEIVSGFNGTIIRTSGNQQFDAMLGQAVLTPLAREFNIQPGFGYYSEAEFSSNGGTENAIASTRTRVDNTRGGTVVFGLNLLRNSMRQPGGDFAVMAICAHEFGHIKQYEGLYDTLAASLPAYCIELHADFIAGYFVRTFAERVPQTDLQRIGAVWSQMGHRTETGSHGTSAMRVRAIEAGFEWSRANRGSRTISAAMDAGVRHVSQYRT